MDCMICDIASGKGKLPLIYEGKYWIVNHVYPSQIKGWLALSIKNHKTAFHKISEKEIEELSSLILKLTKLLKKTTNCKKEYILSSNECVEHFHFHIVPRAKDLKKEWIGPKIYNAIRIKEEDSISNDELILFSKFLKNKLK